MMKIIQKYDENLASCENAFSLMWDQLKRLTTKQERAEFPLSQRPQEQQRYRPPGRIAIQNNRSKVFHKSLIPIKEHDRENSKAHGSSSLRTKFIEFCQDRAQEKNRFDRDIFELTNSPGRAQEKDKTYFKFELDLLKKNVDEKNKISRFSNGHCRKFMLALKNDKNYMILYHEIKHINLIEDGSQLYTGSFRDKILMTSEDGGIVGTAYVKTLNFYIFLCSGKIFRKDIDKKPPYPYIDTGTQRYNSDFFYSQYLNRIFIIERNWVKKKSVITVVNLEKAEIEAKYVDNDEHDYLGNEFKLMGHFENNLVSYTEQGRLRFYIFEDTLSSISKFADYQISLCINEDLTDITACDKVRFLLAQIESFYSDDSQIVVFCRKGGILEKRQIVDQSQPSLDLDNDFPMVFFGWSGDHIHWFKIIGGLPLGRVHLKIYDFDTRADKLMVLEDEGCKARLFSGWESHVETKFVHLDQNKKLIYLILGNRNLVSLNFSVNDNNDEIFGRGNLY